MYIEFGELKLKLFLPFIFPLFTQIRTFVFYNKDEHIIDNSFFKMFRYYLSHILAGICIIIIQIRTKIIKRRSSKQIQEIIKAHTNNSNSVEWINPLEIQKKIILQKKSFYNYLFIFLLVLIGLLSNTLSIALNNKLEDYSDELYLSKQSIGVLCKIAYLILFSKIILKIKIYRHHIFSLYIILFGSFIIILCFVFYFKFKITINALVYHLVTSLFFCLFDIFGKKYLDKFCDSPYQIMLKIGIVSVIIIFIYDLIAFIINGDKDSDISGVIYGFKNNFKLLNILFILLDIILCFFWNTGIWLTLYYLTPCHFIISESLSEYLYYTIDYILYGNYKIRDVIIHAIIYIINFFFFLVFDEIIILKVFNLDKYTNKMIIERESNDKHLSKSIKSLTELFPNEINEGNLESPSYDPGSLYGSQIMGSINNAE